MSNTLFNNHPLINNSDQYFFERKYLSVHSEDRDYIRYPNSSEFEILLPQDYLNVVSTRLASWSFPSNYNVFSVLSNYNVNMIFKFTNLYNPGEKSVINPLLEGIFAALYNNIDENYIITIETGFYNPEQMATELTNKFNEAVTIKINEFFEANSEQYAIAKSLFLGYDRFKIVYNTVSMKLWFGNTTDSFVLKNTAVALLTTTLGQANCIKSKALPEFDTWGLPGYLGFTRCDVPSLSMADFSTEYPDISFTKNLQVPRFYYGDAVPSSGDNGYWLLPGAPEATVYFLEAPFKISFIGPDHIYMEIDGMNCIDETSPWNLSEYTVHNNQTNGIVRSAFAKIPLPCTPLSQFFDRDAISYKYWNPPAERISKLKIRFRFHNGQLVQFGQFNFTFMLEFNLLRPQQERDYSVRTAFDLGQVQSFGNKYFEANDNDSKEMYRRINRR
jgi:hypothetical protein